MTPPPPGKSADPTIIGWMEMVDLPDLGLDALKAKIDTGARTSALHATDIRTFERDGVQWVAFMADSGQGLCDRPIEAVVHTVRAIKNTSGIAEQRFVIRTRVRIARRLWMVELSLSDRTNMTFPMIVGRTAFKRKNIAVHAQKTFLMTTKATLH